MADASESVGVARGGRRGARAANTAAPQNVQSPNPDTQPAAAGGGGGGGWGEATVPVAAASATPAASSGGGGWGGPVSAAGVQSTSTTAVSAGGMVDLKSAPAAGGAGGAAAGRRRGGDEAARKAAAADDDKVVDMQEIPDLEEAIQDDITTKVAQAPNVRAHKVQALTELDAEVVNQLPTLPDGIDLSLLQNALTPYEKVTEPDHAWEYDLLFTSVSSELQTEMDIASGEAGERDGDDEKDGTAPSASAAAAAAAPLRPRGAAAAATGDSKDQKS